MVVTHKSKINRALLVYILQLERDYLIWSNFLWLKILIKMHWMNSGFLLLIGQSKMVIKLLWIFYQIREELQRKNFMSIWRQFGMLMGLNQVLEEKRKRKVARKRNDKNLIYNDYTIYIQRQNTWLSIFRSFMRYNFFRIDRVWEKRILIILIKNKVFYNLFNYFKIINNYII